MRGSRLFVGERDELNCECEMGRSEGDEGMVDRWVGDWCNVSGLLYAGERESWDGGIRSMLMSTGSRRWRMESGEGKLHG